jgi:hypothetical protein
MKKKSQIVTPITIFFYYIGFLIVWVLFASKIIREQGQLAIVNNGLTGIEAMMFSNLNLVVFIISIIFLLAGMYVTNNQQ